MYIGPRDSTYHLEGERGRVQNDIATAYLRLVLVRSPLKIFRYVERIIWCSRLSSVVRGYAVWLITVSLGAFVNLAILGRLNVISSSSFMTLDPLVCILYPTYQLFEIC